MQGQDRRRSVVCSAVVAVLMQDPEEVLTRAGFYTMGFEGSSLGGRAGGGGSEMDIHRQLPTLLMQRSTRSCSFETPNHSWAQFADER